MAEKDGTLKIKLLISSAAGFIAVFIFRRNLAAEASILGYFGFIPEELLDGSLSAADVTGLFCVPLAGFIYFNFFDIINVALITVLFLPVLHMCYRRVEWMGVTGAVLIFSCFCLYIASNQALTLFLNRDNIQQLNVILLKSETRFILNEFSVLLLYSFGLFVTIILKKLALFSGYTFAFGLLTNMIGLLYFPAGLFIGESRYLAIVIAAPFTVMWHFNIAANLLKYRKNISI